MSRKWYFILSASVGAALVGLAVMAIAGAGKEKRTEKAEPKAGTAGDVVLSTEDFRAATPLINQIVSRMNAAAKKLSDNDIEGARSEVAAAERLFDTVRNLLRESDSDSRFAPLGRAAPGSAIRRPRWFDPFDTDDLFGNDWDPFRSIREMQEHMRRMLDEHRQRFKSGFGSLEEGDVFMSPSMDLSDEGDKYVVRLDMPGLDKSNIKVNVEGRLLTISGQSESSAEEKDGNRIIRRERRSGMFHRSITLPGPVVSDKVEAKYENGVLVVSIPKADEEIPSKSVPVY